MATRRTGVRFTSSVPRPTASTTASTAAARTTGAFAVAQAPAPANDMTLEEREKKLDDAIGELIHDAVDPDSAAPTKVQDYVGRAGSGGTPPIRKLSDIPPFKWIDLAVLVPAWIAIAAWQIISTAGTVPANMLDRSVAIIALYCLAFAGLYGAIVFPIRYYLRHRPVRDALLKYLATSAMFFLAGAGVMLSGMDRGYLEGADFMRFLELFAIAWGGLSVLAFVIYGVLAGQRAIRSFRSNIKKL